MKRIKKAWHVWHKGMIGTGPEIYNSVEETPIYYAETSSKAKIKSSEVYDFEIDGETHKFTDIKARRAPDADIYLFEGIERKKYQIVELLEQRQKIKDLKDKINQYPDDSTFYVQNGFVGNSMLFWALNSNGYTCDFNKAQEYTKAEILEGFVPGRAQDRIWLADHLKQNTCTVIDGQHVNYKFKI